MIREAFHKHQCSDEFHDYVQVPGGVARYYLEVAKAIVRFNPSVILVRQEFGILPWTRLFAPFTPIIMQFHGHEIRYQDTLPWQATLASKRISSTRDITKWADYYGTPIHPMFEPAPSGVRREGTALFIRIDKGAKDCIEAAIEFAKREKLELDIIDRTKGEYIPHKQMPGVLQKYEWYLDLKGLTSSAVLSKTAIEFLHTADSESPGKVLTDTGDIVTRFSTTSLDDYLELIESML
jgi:hypothetical protein